MNLILALSLNLLSQNAHADMIDDCNHFWGEIRKTNDRFEEHKDMKAGKTLLGLLPSEKIHPPVDCKKYGETIDALYRDDAYRNQLMKSGKDLGFQLAFRLTRIADGAFAESLVVDLSNTILKTPAKFLKFYKEEKGDTFCSKDIVMATDVDEALDEKQTAALMQKRIHALEKVKDAALSGLKADCIKTLSPGAKT